jgi:diguanylate cyclase (GGDEF)-like protein
MGSGMITKGLGTGAIFAVVAQVAIVSVAALSFSFFGTDFLPFALILFASLVLLNAGLAFQYLHRRRSNESSRRLRLLAEMNVQVNREILLNENIELIYRTILDYLFSIFDTVTTGSILILDDDGYLRFAASRGFTETYVQQFHLKLEDSFLYQDTGGAISETRLITQETIARLVTKFAPGDWEYKSVISAPLFVGDRLFGILNLDSDRTRIFDTDDASIVERFRTQIEVGLLARERYRSSIERYHVDSLTGLFTRRYFEDLFSLTLERALRYDETFVIALFDVDQLKYVNDTFGHLAGDQMLLSIAKALRASCRKSDIIGRFGGDEFIAAYHVADMATIEKSIAAIQSSLRNTPASFAEKERLLSFSYGLARFPDDGNDLVSLTAAADKRLYAMKAERKAA